MVLVADRLVDQEYSTENQEIDPYKYTQLIFDEDVKAIQLSKDCLSISDAGVIGLPKAKMNVDLSFTSYKKLITMDHRLNKNNSNNKQKNLGERKNRRKSLVSRARNWLTLEFVDLIPKSQPIK